MHSMHPVRQSITPIVLYHTLQLSDIPSHLFEIPYHTPTNILFTPSHPFTPPGNRGDGSQSTTPRSPIKKARSNSISNSNNHGIYSNSNNNNHNNNGGSFALRHSNSSKNSLNSLHASNPNLYGYGDSLSTNDTTKVEGYESNHTSGVGLHMSEGNSQSNSNSALQQMGLKKNHSNNSGKNSGNLAALEMADRQSMDRFMAAQLQQQQQQQQQPAAASSNNHGSYYASGQQQILQGKGQVTTRHPSHPSSSPPPPPHSSTLTHPHPPSPIQNRIILSTCFFTPIYAIFCHFYVCFFLFFLSGSTLWRSTRCRYIGCFPASTFSVQPSQGITR